MKGTYIVVELKVHRWASLHSLLKEDGSVESQLEGTCERV